MIEKLTSEELDFLEALYDPIAFAECIFSNIDNLGEFNEEKFSEVRLPQFSMMSYEYLLDTEDPTKTPKENFKQRESTGTVHCYGGRKYGKCEWEENHCWLADGTIKQFKDLIGTTQEVFSYNQQLNKIEKSLASFEDNGKKKCIKIILESGKEIVVTENHPLLTNFGWTPAQEINLDNFIATPKNIELEGLVVDDNLAKLLGYLIGDGGCSQPSIAFTNVNEEIISEFNQICDYFECKTKKFDITYSISAKVSTFNNLGRRNSNKIKELVLKYNLNKLAKHKRIPEEVFKWSNKSIALLLNRYFACDGYFNNLTGVVEVGSASKRLLQDIQLLLLRFGIFSRLYYKEVECQNKKFDSWRLMICRDIKLFLEKIGVFTKDCSFNYKQPITRTNDCIPKNFIEEIYESLRLKKELTLRKLKKYNPTRDKLQRINQIIQDSRVDKLINENINWEKINSIEYLKELSTVAVCVPGNENYISNGIYSHNTKYVEQVDLLEAMVLNDNEKCGFSSFDAMHIRGVLEDIITALENHPFLSLFEARINRSPTYRIYLKNGFCLDGINMNLSGDEPGGQFFQKHLTRLYMEEACVDGHTKIRYYDEFNQLKTKNISDLINSEEYKKIKVLSYNEKLQIVEKKQVTKIFKKKVQDSEVYTFTTNEGIGGNFKTLKVSGNHRLFINNQYKYANDGIKVGDKMYLLDQCGIDEIQKQVLVGCLLGNSCINKKNLSSLSIVHSVKQKPLLDYEKNCLSSLFTTYRKTKNSRHTVVKAKSIGNIIKYVSKETKVLKEFNDFKYCKVGAFYTKVNKEQLEKYLTPISLAFFIMDDGSISTYNCKKSDKVNNYIYLHTEAFDIETNQLILDTLKNKFDIDGSICKVKKYSYLAFDSKNSEKLINLVKDYIHPSMLYKINKKSNNFINLENSKYKLYPTIITNIKKEILSSWTMYCFEVEDNHNFFANSILTGNSFETEKVFAKRLDAISEFGCIERFAGMTNFTKHSPAGKVFYDLKKKSILVNYPQYVSHVWGPKEKERAIKEHGGEDSVSYRIFVKGEVVEDGISAMDMERIRKNYNDKKTIKHFEITKENFPNYEYILILERPTNAENVYIATDVGENVTEIIIIFQVNNNYQYRYNITCYNLTDKEQTKILKFLGIQLTANFIGIDTTDGMGRAIFRSLEEIFPKENLVWVGFNEKIRIGIDKDENGREIFKDGQPVYKEEYVDGWSIKRLRDLLYEEGRVDIPLDYKLDVQLNSIIVTQSGNRTLYCCVASEDHLLAAWRVFAIAEWLNYMTINRPIVKKAFCKSGI